MEIERVVSTRIDLIHLRDEKLARLLAYWSGHVIDSSIPLRSSIQPEDFSYLLGFVCLIEVRQNPQDFIMRLVGSTIENWMGQHPKGKSIKDLKPALYAEEVAGHYREVVSSRQPSLYRIETFCGTHSGAYTRLLLPLSNDGAGVHSLLAASAENRSFRTFATYRGSLRHRSEPE